MKKHSTFVLWRDLEPLLPTNEDASRGPGGQPGRLSQVVADAERMLGYAPTSVWRRLNLCRSGRDVTMPVNTADALLLAHQQPPDVLADLPHYYPHLPGALEHLEAIDWAEGRATTALEARRLANELIEAARAAIKAATEEVAA